MVDEAERINGVSWISADKNSTINVGNSIGTQIQYGYSKEDLVQLIDEKLLPRIETLMKDGIDATVPSLKHDAQAEILKKVVGDSFLSSDWLIYLSSTVYPLQKKYGAGESVKIALLGEGLPELSVETMHMMSLKYPQPVSGERSAHPFNIIPLTVINTICPGSEIAYLKTIPGTLLELLMAAQWCADNEVDIVVLLFSMPPCGENCLICRSLQKLVERGITVIYPDGGWHRAIPKGVVPVGSYTIGENRELAFPDNYRPAAPKIVALGQISGAVTNTFVISGLKPLIIHKTREYDSPYISACNVAGIAGIIASYLKMVNGSATPGQIDSCLIKATKPITAKIVASNNTMQLQLNLFDPHMLIEGLG